jgi:hypothetical protein
MSMGKSPEYDRALELVRQGMAAIAVSGAVGIPSAVIKRWARKAGIKLAKPTLADRQATERRWDETRAIRRAYRMDITARVDE